MLNAASLAVECCSQELKWVPIFMSWCVFRLSIKIRLELHNYVRREIESSGRSGQGMQYIEYPVT